MLTVGERAPDFELPLHTGGVFRLSDQEGKKIVVLYFYPRDLTWSCTREACTFRNHVGDIDKYEASIVGISADGLESHKQFARQHRLNFPLASDMAMDVCKRYGAVWFGTARIKRLTFVVDKIGIIRGKFHHELFVDRHYEDVVRLLKNIQKATTVPEGTPKT